MNLISIPALEDNYIWLLQNDQKECLIVDPGEASPVMRILETHHLTLTCIMLTHHHRDHVAGVRELLQSFSVPVYGPKETKDKGTNRIVSEGDKIISLNKNFTVLDLPGHTLGHVGFYSSPWLFCGDTLFSSGCGRIFEGTIEQMYNSVQKINQLPPETFICSAHEYTLDNIKFLASLFPEDKEITTYQCKIKQLRMSNLPTLPTTLSLERKMNPFLRCNDVTLHKKLKIHPFFGNGWNVFSELRKQKDQFQ